MESFHWKVGLVYRCRVNLHKTLIINYLQNFDFREDFLIRKFQKHDDDLIHSNAIDLMFSKLQWITKVTMSVKHAFRNPIKMGFQTDTFEAAL